jgi:hypothetical protein
VTGAKHPNKLLSLTSVQHNYKRALKETKDYNKVMYKCEEDLGTSCKNAIRSLWFFFFFFRLQKINKRATKASYQGPCGCQTDQPSTYYSIVQNLLDVISAQGFLLRSRTNHGSKR